MRILQFFSFVVLLLQQKEIYPQYAFASFDEDMYVNFSYTSLGLTVSFNNYSVASGNIYWDFGDGDSSNLSNPVHVYATAGEYLVELTITTSDKCIASDTQTIILSPSASLTNIDITNTIEVFPNPFTNTLYISSTHYIPLAMWDLFGNKVDVDVLQIAHDKFLLTSLNLISGLYLVELQDGECHDYYIVTCISSD